MSRGWGRRSYFLIHAAWKPTFSQQTSESAEKASRSMFIMRIARTRGDCEEVVDRG